MVKIKKQITIILILTLCLSLIPNFSYNEIGEVLAQITPKDIRCKWGAEEPMTTRSCFPPELVGEMACGVEIPIGEVMDRTSILASKIEIQFIKGIIENANLLIEKADELINNLPNYTCTSTCKSECYKWIKITGRLLVPIRDCPNTDTVTLGGSEPCQECTGDSTVPKCEDYRTHAWETTVGNTTCPYKVDTSVPNWCSTSTDWCMVLPSEGKCDWYSDPFDPAQKVYQALEKAREELKKDIESDAPEKFKISNILERLNYSRCELSKCYISAEEYPEIMAGKKTGKQLYSCQAVQDMGLLDDDQIACIMAELLLEKEGLEQPGVWDIVKAVFKIVWKMIIDFFTGGREQGCNLSNYYCCQI